MGLPLINGHFRNLNWRYLPYISIYKAYVRAMVQGMYPQNIAIDLMFTNLIANLIANRQTNFRGWGWWIYAPQTVKHITQLPFGEISSQIWLLMWVPNPQLLGHQSQGLNFYFHQLSPTFANFTELLPTFTSTSQHPWEIPPSLRLNGRRHGTLALDRFQAKGNLRLRECRLFTGKN